MFILGRLFFACGAALAVLFAVLAGGCLCGTRLGLDLDALRELPDTFDRELTRREEMDAEYRVAAERLVARRRVAAALIAGRLSVYEAAARFHDMDQEQPDLYRKRLYLYYEGATEEERYWRQAVAFTAQQVPEGPEREAVLRRLEDELQELLDRGAFTIDDDRTGRARR
jgi:hypothetical protein